MKRTFCIIIALIMILLLCGCDKIIVPKEFEVTFDPNGGSVTQGEAAQKVRPGENAVPPEVAKEGFEFAGWDGEYNAVDSARTITAKWDRLYRVVFDPGEGEIDGEAAIFVKEGKLPEAPVPTRALYTFAGWSPELAPASEDVTYTAVWEKKALNAEEVFELVSPAVIEIQAEDDYGAEWLGSGFFINDEGVALTNFHVMVGVISAKAVMADGSEYEITGVYDYDKDLDLCAIKVDITGNEFLTPFEGKVVTGQTVYAIGSPRGYTGSLSSGIVSSASRIEDGTDYIQITAPISPGNSGGPLVNEYGEVLGVNAMQRTDAQNLNFSVNIDQMDELMIRTPISFDRFTEESGTDHTFYTLFLDSEHERNGSETYADKLEDQDIICAEINKASDMDYFTFHLEQGQTAEVSLVFYDDEEEGELYYEYGYLIQGEFIYKDLDFEWNDMGFYTAEFTAERETDYYLVFSGSGLAADDSYYPLHYIVILFIE